MENYTFYIQMQMIVDGLSHTGIACTLYNNGILPKLLDIRFFRGRKSYEPDCLYIAEAADLSGYSKDAGDSLQALVVVGDPENHAVMQQCSVIVVQKEADLLSVHEAVNQVFYRARNWNAGMQNIINNHGSLDELCRTAEEYFENPLFVHNPHFYILACHTHYEGMDPWQRDERTGQPMLSADLINGFKMNPEYIDTLNKVGSQIFPIDSTGYRVMYVNLWDDFGRYEGRICIDEILSAFQPGQMVALEHFGRMAMILIRQRNAQNLPFEKPLEHLITDLINGKNYETAYVEGILEMEGWKINDSYRVFKMELDQRDVQASSMINTCNYIEGAVNECHAIQEGNAILVVLNNSRSTQKEDERMQILNRIVRETILMTGISNLFQDFHKISFYYRQAALALRYGLKKNPTIWIHRFENYVMDYCFDLACNDLPAEYICAPELMQLRQYDRDKHTELYNTLKMYLMCMLNAEQTARELYIHRSTLFYRLKKIREVTGLNLNETNHVFYILFSIQLIERKGI